MYSFTYVYLIFQLQLRTALASCISRVVIENNHYIGIIKFLYMHPLSALYIWCLIQCVFVGGGGLLLLRGDVN